MTKNGSFHDFQKMGKSVQGVQIKSIAIIGLGYVGLPLSFAASVKGYKVYGLDHDSQIVLKLNNGQSHVDDVPAEMVEIMLENGFEASSDFEILKGVDVIVICVPTPLSREGSADISAIIAVTRGISTNLKKGQLVILESTTYPGTTDEVVKPLLEESGLVAGIDFHLAFSPERVDPGNRDFGISNTPKVVGGHTPVCADMAVEFYEKFVEQVLKAAGTREAELAKLIENTYRFVNISLMNELAQFAKELGIDLWNAIECASSKPFGFHPFYPGPGIGGHCIPIDPNYLAFKVKSEFGQPFRFIELAQEINSAMPSYVVKRAQDLLNNRRLPLNGAKVLIVGVTYKPNINDARETPAFPIAKLLHKKGADVMFHDFFVSEWNFNESPAGEVLVPSQKSQDDVYIAASMSDLVILLQAHKEYDLQKLAQASHVILDTRGVLEGLNIERL